jgi:probable F420-dependent oxidoreductase
MTDVVAMLTHRHAGRRMGELAASLGVDPKTVRKYTAPALAAGSNPGGPPLSTTQWCDLAASWMRQRWFTHVRLLVAHLTRSCRAFIATLTTPALDRRSLRCLARTRRRVPVGDCIAQIILAWPLSDGGRSARQYRRGMDLGRFGIWWSGSWNAGEAPLEDVAAEMETLGYQTLWMSGGFSPGIQSVFKRLVDSTQHATIATGILSVWPNDPSSVGAEVAELGPRFMLGIGASHAVIVEGSGTSYERPFHKVATWLDALDASDSPVPPDHRILAALGPRMLALGAERSLGAHPYVVTLEHTVRAREILGTGPVLAPEVAVVLGTDVDASRAAARNYAALYLSLPNYTNNLISLGWDTTDIEGGGSDRLIDALIPWGTPEAVAARLEEHHAAGADHVCVQIVRDPSKGAEYPLHEYRELAAALVR